MMNTKNRVPWIKTSAVAVAVCMFTSGWAGAQALPDPSDELRRNQERLREQQQRAQPLDVRPQAGIGASDKVLNP